MLRITQTLFAVLVVSTLSVTTEVFAADTFENAITLHNSGVSDEVLIAWAEKQPPIDATPQHLAQLKVAQISNAVVQALLTGNTKDAKKAVPPVAAAPVPAKPDDTEIRAAANAAPQNPAPTVVIDGNNVYNYDPCETSVIGWANVYNFYPQAGYGFPYRSGWRSILNVDLFPTVIIPSWGWEHNHFPQNNAQNFHRDGDWNTTHTPQSNPNYGYRSGTAAGSISRTPAASTDSGRTSPTYVTQRPAPVQTIQNTQSSPTYVTQRPTYAPAPVQTSGSNPQSPSYYVPPTATPTYRR
jgi:hypothetical protein